LKILINSIESDIPDSSLQKIGQGGEGVIYLITLDGEKYAIKKYYKPNESLHKKIKAMLDRAPNDSVQKINSQTFIQLAWPIGLCYDSGSFCGFVMPYVDLKHTNTLDFYLDPRLFKEKFGVGNLSLTFKIEIARNLAGVVKLLHSKGHFFIDFKPQNVRVYDRYHLISLIDCDGFSIEGTTGERFPANGYSSEYIYPEALQKNKRPQELSLKQDLFALSVVIFQLMNYGIHPFSGIISSGDEATTTDDKVAKGYYPYGLDTHPHIRPLNYSTHKCFPHAIRILFDRAFSSNGGNPPAVEEWISAFENIISSQNLQKCKKHPTKADHIHFDGHECMACMREEITSNIKIKTKPYQSAGQYINSSTSSSPIPAGGSAPFWSPNKLWGVAIFIVISLLIFYEGPKENSKQSAPSYGTGTTTSVNPSQAAGSQSAYSIMSTLSRSRWSSDSSCRQYWQFIKNQNDSYSLSVVDLDDPSDDFVSPVLSYSFIENYKLDNGTIIKNVMKLKTKDAYLDVAYIEGPIPSIRLYHLEDMQNNLVITQGKRLKDLSPTLPRKKCY
jgi:serine/threonine protein kinase